jgi:hypothetical protein
MFYIYWQKPFYIRPNTWWEVVMNVSRVKIYDPLNGGTLWSCRGVEGVSTCNHDFDRLGGVKIDFCETQNREFPWRTSLQDGQLPYFLFWPL